MKRSPSCYQQNGFTLLEFLLASAIGLLLGAAVLSLYFYTSRLNHIAGLNLSVHEDLRAISRSINQDAAMAGSFGCLSLTSLYSQDSKNIDDQFNRQFHVYFNDSIPKDSPIVFDKPGDSARSSNQNFGVALLNPERLKIPNFQAKSKALTFYYAIGEASAFSDMFTSTGDTLADYKAADNSHNQYVISAVKQGGYIAFGSCHGLDIFKAKPSNTDIVNEKEVIHLNEETLGDVRMTPTIAAITNEQTFASHLMRYIVHSYVVGQFNNGPLGLYKIELNENGSWGPPVLLSSHVSKMQVSFIYPTDWDKEHQHPLGCPSAFNDDVYTNDKQTLEEKFNQYQFFERDNPTFTATHDPQNPKGGKREDLKKVLKAESSYLAPSAVNVVLTVNYPKLSRPFGLGKNDDGLSTESSHVDLNDNKSDKKLFRIFSSIKGGNECADRNLVD